MKEGVFVSTRISMIVYVKRMKKQTYKGPIIIDYFKKEYYFCLFFKSVAILRFASKSLNSDAFIFSSYTPALHLRATYEFQ